MPRGAAIGAIIGTCFAFGWAAAGLQGVTPQWRALLFAASLVASTLLGAALVVRLRSSSPVAAPASFDGAVYGWAVTLECVAIIIAVVALRRSQRTDYVMPVVAFIVGAHFFGLARAMTSGGGGVFIYVGTLMCVSAGAIIFALAHSILSPSQSIAITGFGCAVILWASALSTLL